MLIYRCDCYDPDEGTIVSWHWTKREAEAEAKNCSHGHGSVERVFVPTDRMGLITWLNVHFNRDNG